MLCILQRCEFYHVRVPGIIQQNVCTLGVCMRRASGEYVLVYEPGASGSIQYTLSCRNRTILYPPGITLRRLSRFLVNSERLSLLLSRLYRQKTRVCCWYVVVRCFVCCGLWPDIQHNIPSSELYLHHTPCTSGFSFGTKRFFSRNTLSFVIIAESRYE